MAHQIALMACRGAQCQVLYVSEVRKLHVTLYQKVTLHQTVFCVFCMQTLQQSPPVSNIGALIKQFNNHLHKIYLDEMQAVENALGILWHMHMVPQVVFN